MTYGFDFSQLYYNEYFTEYDADNFTNSVSFRIYPYRGFHLDLEYAFKVSNADGEDAFSEPEKIDVTKDASYEADLYKFNLSYDIWELLDDHIIVGAGFSHKEYYFQADNIFDTYHCNRQDLVNMYEFYTDIPFISGKKVRLDYLFEDRNTDSHFDTVERDKKFKRYQVGITFIVKL